MVEIRKPKIYLETSVFNYYFPEGVDEDDNLDTIELFREVKEGSFSAFYSEVVLIEIDRCSEPKRTKMLDLIDEYQIRPVSNYKEAEELATIYLNEKVVPLAKRNDALHLALTTVNGLDTLVSWNCKHIVKFKVRRLINLLNEANGYRRIDLNTPREVIEVGK